ncbi:MAG: hypothetical protein JXN10_02575 [Clostridia bacterium]|nr:hypothetical protein [Clostridia bacterium]
MFYADICDILENKLLSSIFFETLFNFYYKGSVWYPSVRSDMIGYEGGLNLKFTQFAKLMFAVAGAGNSTSAFTRTLFLSIVTYEEEELNPIYDYKDSTFKAYYNGTNDITKLARKISTYIEPEEFVLYIESLTDAAVEALCASFAPYIPDIDSYSAAIDLANLFKSIIIEAASTDKKIAPANAVGEIAILNDQLDKLFGTRLLVEAKGLCPNDNCCKHLYLDSNGQTTMNYTITQIDPATKENQINNVIALCPECSKKYILTRNTDGIARMKEIKAQLIRESAAIDTLSNTNVEEGVERVLRKIADPELQLVPLNYDPVELKLKILPENRPLYIKTKGYVTEYFSVVHGTFQQLSKESKLRFTPFCMQIKLNYLNLRDRGLSQPEIFDAMATWIAVNTNDRKDLCEIVISYFVQKCEVFDAVAE